MPVAELRRRIPCPPLENGDILSRKEFHRRYLKATDIKKAELVEGRVHVASPVYFETHSRPDSIVGGWLLNYSVRLPGLKCGGNVSVKIDGRNEYQPDQVMFVRPDLGGQLREATKCLIGAPEFVAEISGSSISIDAGPKRNVYERIGVREFLLVRTYDEEVDWLTLRSGRFEPLPRSGDVIRSAVFPGLWLNVPALLAGDAAAVLETLNQGMSTPEFAAYRALLSPDAVKGEPAT